MEQCDSILDDIVKKQQYRFCGDKLPDASVAIHGCIYLVVQNDLVIIDGQEHAVQRTHGHIALDGIWVDLGLYDASDFETAESTEAPTNCPNCGAPLHGGRCDYCGTYN